MLFRQELTLLVACVAAGVILHFVPYDAEKVALLRLEEKLGQQTELAEAITTRCGSLETQDNQAPGRFFLKRFRPAPGAAEGLGRCLVVLESASSQRFFVRNYWHFGLSLRSDGGNTVYRNDYNLECPRPLALLPLAVFLLSLLWGFEAWGMAWTLGAYLLLLGGGNLIRAVEMGVRNTAVTLSGSQPLLGTLMVLAWIAIHRCRKDRKPLKTHSLRAESWFNKGLSVLVGLWNPALFSAAAKLYLPFRGAIARVSSFLDAQFFIACGSLYLLSADLHDPRRVLTESLLLPRYFSFGGILFLSLAYWQPTGKKRGVAWHHIRLWRAVAFVLIGQLVALRVPQIRELSTVTRVGFALLLSELVVPKGISWRLVLKSFLPWAGMLLMATFITLQSVQSGVSHLILVLWEPTAHPTSVALFTFVSGVFLGFVTGNFATTFFTLYGVLVRSFDVPLVKAALVDGILAGSLLSPFSLLNLFPAAQFGLNLQSLVKFRFKQLGVPLAIATLIYAVCAINSVAILQPVTFVFLCLLALAARLKKNSWVWRGFTRAPT